MIKTTTEFVGHKVDNRYAYDFGLCSSKSDWAQMDTAQDAPWFGQWANPFERQILCYAEGDGTLIECDTDAEFASELDRITAFHRENDQWKGIDTWSVRIRERFAAAGARHLVYPACFDMKDPEGAEHSPETDAPRSGTADAAHIPAR